MGFQKQIYELNTNWKLRLIGKSEDEWMKIKRMPSQVADVLLDYRKIPEEIKLGWCQDVKWIAQEEWEYCCEFSRPQGKRSRLVFKGLDTLATIYLNGKQIGTHDDFYMPESIEITSMCQEKNILCIRFHSVLKWLEQTPMPKYLEGAVLKCKLLRKPIHDFPLSNRDEECSYQGAVPSFTPVGIYDRVYLETWDETEVTLDNIQAYMQEEQGIVSFEIEGNCGKTEELEAEVWIYQENEYIEKQCFSVKSEKMKFQAAGKIEIQNPRLWWPMGFGEHPLYTVKILLKNVERQQVVDSVIKKVGFRKVESPVPLAFIINGKKVRLWGGSMDPIQGYTHCYQPDRAERIFDMIENAHMNTLRIWGEGIPLPEEFYDEADRRGILIWQEFFLGHGAYPDSEEFGQKCVEEAEVLVRRLRHHPSLLMWCGGNETIMGAEYARQYPFGDWIVKTAFPQMLERLGENRYYHVNSPYGGEWANDPREGDTHTYECVWEYPYKDYPNFISESIRTAPPAKYSLEKFIKGPLWKQNYDGKMIKPNQGIMPENWLQRMHPFADGERYSGDYWEYYDAVDTDSMLYRFGASYGAAMTKIGEQVRRGNKEKADFIHRSKGYMACKLLDTWPKVFCAIIDYFQEGYIPYYATLRMLSPVMVSFANEDKIRLFAVNDSAEDFRGIVETGIYNLRTEIFERRELISVLVEQGDCVEVNDLSKYKFFSKDCILYARLMDLAGRDVYTGIHYVDIERHLPFGEPELQVTIQGDELIIEARHFARCVSIIGTSGSNEFGWLFSDNYFDLLPGMKKKVKILGKHSQGILSIKAQYSDRIHKVFYNTGGKYEEDRFK